MIPKSFKNCTQEMEILRFTKCFSRVTEFYVLLVKDENKNINKPKNNLVKYTNETIFNISKIDVF